MNKSLQLLLFILFPLLLLSQDHPISSDGNLRMTELAKRNSLTENSLVANIPFESIGPTIFSGRVTDIAVNPEDPSIFYVAYASGGLWKTENNGTSFTPIFDNEAVMTIGDIAVNWNTAEIWVGTGEVNSSRSSYAGIGIFKSNDDGENWEYLGLPESHHIGRIIIDPENPKRVWVAALGHLYSPNAERGVYRTVDGGQTWELVLFINENAGVVDLVIDPSNPDILYAASWERTRRAWNFVESGQGSAIYKSMDGGTNWEKMVEGFPQGDGVGRIGLAIAKNGETTKLYAFLDNYFRRPTEEKEKEDLLTKEDFETMSKEEFLKIEEEALRKYLETNGYPEKYSVKKVKKMVKKGKIEVKALYDYWNDANRLLFDTPVIGAEVYVSDDEGASWRKTHEEYLDGVYHSYGYYFGLIGVSPFDPNTIIIGGVPLLISTDGGKHFESINAANVHADHHALWFNPKREGHIINGNDGGINISYDFGKNWIKCNSPAVGQFYYINTDYAKPYHVYGGTQDNGVWEGSHRYAGGVRWHSSGQYPYKGIMGGDGMQVQIDSRDNQTVYTGYQFGNYFRINKAIGKSDYITPKHELGEQPFRWNWQSPIHLSTHNQDILYMGAHKVFRSMNKGKDFKAISEDLTQGGRKGDVPYGTLTYIHESELKFGLIYAGSDDGLIHLTKDGGNSWDRISDALPKDFWVSRVQASQHEKSRVYVSLNGYRWDDFNAYIYLSEDYGENWQQIGLDLPMEPVNVIKEDPVDEDILYLGTDHGAFVSLDRGKSFMRFKEGLPHAPVHDLVIQKEANHLLIGTHGRSIYKADISSLQSLNENMDEELYVFEIEDLRYSPNYGKKYNIYRKINTPEMQWPVYSKERAEVEISINTKEGKRLKSFRQAFEKGINFVKYDLSIEEKEKSRLEKFLDLDKKKDPIKAADNGVIYLRPGEYQITVKSKTAEHSREFSIKERKR